MRHLQEWKTCEERRFKSYNFAKPQFRKAELTVVPHPLYEILNRARQISACKHSEE